MPEDRHAATRALPFDILARALGIDVSKFKSARVVRNGPGTACAPAEEKLDRWLRRSKTRPVRRSESRPPIHAISHLRKRIGTYSSEMRTRHLCLDGWDWSTKS
jgi:hypothetical protein